MRSMQLTLADITKHTSSRWPSQSLYQWIESTFGHDDEVCDAAITQAYRFIQETPQYAELKQNETTEYSITSWCEHPGVTLSDILACWESVSRRVSQEIEIRSRLSSAQEGDQANAGGEVVMRWNAIRRCEAYNPAIDAFIKDLVDVYKKHGLSISHEDEHGEFRIELYSDDNVEWISGADDATGMN